METPGKSTVIEFNYDEPHCIYYVPESYEQLIGEVSAKFSLSEILRFYYNDFDGDKVSITNDDDLVTALKYCDKNGIVLFKLFVVTPENQYSIENSEKSLAKASNYLQSHLESENVDVLSEPEINEVYYDKEIDNNVFDNHSLDNMFDTINRRQRETNIPDGESDDETIPSEQKQLDYVPESKFNSSGFSVFDMDVAKPATFTKLNRICKDMKPKKSSLMSSVTSLFGMSESRKDFEDMLVVGDESDNIDGNFATLSY